MFGDPSVLPLLQEMAPHRPAGVPFGCVVCVWGAVTAWALVVGEGCVRGARADKASVSSRVCQVLLDTWAGEGEASGPGLLFLASF